VLRPAVIGGISHLFLSNYQVQQAQADEKAQSATNFGGWANFRQVGNPPQAD
jgi:hypothetical protein